MNSIQKINQINRKELENNTTESGSWHNDYRDTSYIFIGNLPHELTEKDIIIIFSQHGIPTHINLIKDFETGKSKGFCYLKYEDHRSCILAIDNFNGIKIFDRSIKVDHVYYKLKEGQNEDDFIIDYSKYEDEEVTKKVIDKESDRKLLEYNKNNDDDFKDPAKNFISLGTNGKDDEFKDPMEEYISKDKSNRRNGDKHRSKHRSKSKRSKEREDDKKRRSKE